MEKRNMQVHNSDPIGKIPRHCVPPGGRTNELEVPQDIPLLVLLNCRRIQIWETTMMQSLRLFLANIVYQ